MVCPRLSNSAPGGSERVNCSVNEKGEVSDTGPMVSVLKLSAGDAAGCVNVATSTPGVSVEVLAPWVLVGSTYQLNVVVAPVASA